ncbi:hypothetical protein GWI33_011181 [Rhynchophorus ferrugineus]|uniref:Uncharacterized protein n=1 Tax=Rhynchophorus ferrugineus TaxID=354439 RepID=A0A834MEY3_RHYFE|nr:hypothetical protein GWI33_011181 [Rhynchophorus ferrugineus]
MRTFEELKEQLYVFERHFIKVSDVKVEQEVLVAKSSKCQKWIADGRPPKDATLKKKKDKTMETNTVLLTTCGEIFARVDENSWWIDVVNTSEVPEPYEDAIKHKDCVKWKRAMDEEIDSLKENKTWGLEDLPKGAKAIPRK